MALESFTIVTDAGNRIEIFCIPPPPGKKLGALRTREGSIVSENDPGVFTIIAIGESGRRDEFVERRGAIGSLSQNYSSGHPVTWHYPEKDIAPGWKVMIERVDGSTRPIVQVEAVENGRVIARGVDGKPLRFQLRHVLAARPPQ